MTVIDSNKRMTESQASSGYNSADDGSYIKVNTETLRVYAERIEAVIRRIDRLNERVETLYLQTGLCDLKSIISAGSLSGYDWHLRNCIKYLNETAIDFDSVERNITEIF